MDEGEKTVYFVVPHLGMVTNGEVMSKLSWLKEEKPKTGRII